MSKAEESVTCPLLSPNNRRIERHHVRLHPRQLCRKCGSEVVTTKDVWRRLRAGDQLSFICEHCSLLPNT